MSDAPAAGVAAGPIPAPRPAGADQAPTLPDPVPTSLLRQVKRLVWPQLWRYRYRVGLALLVLTLAKVANLGVPLAFKQVIDGLSDSAALVVLPALFLLAYGALRIGNSLFGELRGIIMARVNQRAMRGAALDTFSHLHALGLRFHLQRQTGGVARALERGTAAIDDLMWYVVMTIVPTAVEIALASALLYAAYPPVFVLVTLATLALYTTVTVVITEWRTRYYKAARDHDTRANTVAVDSLLNFETVKYFSNEAHEVRRFDQHMQRWEQAAVKSQKTLGLLNGAQGLVITLGMTTLMWLAARGVVDGRMSVGDLVLVNALMIQLSMPLNMLGMMWRDLKKCAADLEQMSGLLDTPREIVDADAAPPLRIAGAAIAFEDVHFGYDPRRPVLRGVSFEVPAGATVAVVGASGAGKSTLSRLLYRFYEPDAGRILVDGQDIATVTQASLRRAIGIVPQDTVLFNDTIRYNIAYGRPEADEAAVQAAARAAHIHDFVASLPDGYRTEVGERGLKLSGGEKQRVAIARTILKDPPILVLDEATSALDTRTERAIQAELETIATGRSTLIVAHRLSTIVGADQILVLADGAIVERGRHTELLAAGGRYAAMWHAQQEHAGAGAVADPTGAAAVSSPFFPDHQEHPHA
jgi:ABC-type transport system involved in Fe-S cluster assembly fused permease/ATPase subunit